jgi:hypothetical protein
MFCDLVGSTGIGGLDPVMPTDAAAVADDMAPLLPADRRRRRRGRPSERRRPRLPLQVECSPVANADHSGLGGVSPWSAAVALASPAAFPLGAAAVAALPVRSYLIDGEAIVVAAIGCSRPSSRLDVRQFVCPADKWPSPRGRLR